MSLKTTRVIFSLCVILFCSLSLCKASEADTTSADSANVLSPTAAVWRSFILPGWGQLYQERLWPAAVMYGVSVSHYYQAALHYKRYRRNKDRSLLLQARNELSIAGMMHALSIFDAFEKGRRAEIEGWPDQLLSDMPPKSPWGAVLRSVMIPGWGQVYNDRYIKAVVYAGLVVYCIDQIDHNGQLFKKTGEGKFREDRIRFGWYLGLTYLLMLTDAYVDAHLYQFDKAVEISVQPLTLQYGVQLHVSYTF